MTRKTAVVTGASSGIGEATAQRLAMAGYKVYGTSDCFADLRLLAWLDAGIRKDLQLDALTASRRRTPILEE